MEISSNFSLVKPKSSQTVNFEGLTGSLTMSVSKKVQHFFGQTSVKSFVNWIYKDVKAEIFHRAMEKMEETVTSEMSYLEENISIMQSMLIKLSQRRRHNRALFFVSEVFREVSKLLLEIERIR